MALEQFETFNFRKSTLARIEQANVIIAEMQAEGYTLTVRQLYYQFVARDLLENTQQNYKNLASMVDNARKAGLIDWDAIEDRTRYLRYITAYNDPASFLRRQAERFYAEALWRDQEVYCEVWVEKDALLGVVERPALEWRVPYFACRGYASSSELYEAGKRLARKRAAGKRVVIFHLGDHDPSGLNMSDVNRDSLRLFARSNGITLERLALNYDQVEEYDPPPNPAKDTDARFGGYADIMRDEHGYEEDDEVPSWELDALNPSVIDQIIRTAIEGVVDKEKFSARYAEEEANKNTLLAAADSWDYVGKALAHRFEEHPEHLLDADDFLNGYGEGDADASDEEEEPEE